MRKIKNRPSLRTHGRRAILKKQWHENCEKPRHAPAGYRRDRVRAVRSKENRHLANAFTMDLLEDYEPLRLAKRDADWLYF